MSDDTIIRTAVEENPWYKLAIMRSRRKPSNYIWNGYMRFLMERKGKGVEADEVRVVGFDLKECGLPKLTPNELTSVQAIIGLPRKPDEISFEGCVFDNGTDFQSFYFPTVVTFRNANFEGEANFIDASFAGAATFTNASFEGGANFIDTSFAGVANFNDAIFADGAYFSRVRFLIWADFTNASFAGASGADFNDTSFATLANFTNASFEDDADFTNASFEGRANFTSTSFEGKANFSASSDTPPHKSSISFTGATFKQAPAFFERQLHEDTDWQDVKWPRRYGRLSLMISRLKKYYDDMCTFFRLSMRAKEIRDASKKQAGDDVRRYESLSLMMSKLEKYDDMHTFFRLSMQAKEIRDGRWSVASVMSRIYGFFFDYGWGVKCAFVLWAGHIFLGSLSIMVLLQCKDAGQALALSFNDALMLSFSNAHSFIGLHSGAQMSLYDAARDIPLFNFIWSVQTLIGLPLLFFLLLTIRNRFRMR